jgi:hypothetical protein
MSRKSDVVPIRPGSSTEQILDAVLRRHGVRKPKPDGSRRLPDPPRPGKGDLADEPQLFELDTSPALAGGKQ